MEREIAANAHEGNNPWWGGFPLDQLGERQLQNSRVRESPLGRITELDQYQRSDFTYHYENITNSRLHLLTAPNGIGKTTTLCRLARQLGKDGVVSGPDLFYFPCDQPLLRAGIQRPLINTVDWYFQNIRASQLSLTDFGTTEDTDRTTSTVYLLVDDIHLIDDWSSQLKDVLEKYPEVNIVGTVPSADGINDDLFEEANINFDSDFLPHRKFHDWITAVIDSLSQDDDDRREQRIKLRNNFREFAAGDEVNFGKEITALLGDFPPQKDPQEFLEHYLRTGDNRRPGKNVGQDIELTIFRDIPRVQSINNPSELHELFAIAAATAGETHSPKRWSSMISADHRTFNRYLESLEIFHLASPSTHYGHEVRRSLRLYPHDPAQLITLCGRKQSVSSQLRERLMMSVIFDHCKRLAFHYNKENTPINFWESNDDMVDFIFRVQDTDETVVLPITFANDDVDVEVSGLESFLDSDKEEMTSGGLVLTAHPSAIDSAKRFERRESALILPTWLFLFII